MSVASARPGFIAHRFGRALGPDLALSTLRRLLASSDPKIVGIEIDCVLSRDGQLVLLHDNHLNESTSLTGWSHEHTAADIQRGRIRHNGLITDQRPMLLDDLWPHLAADGRELILQIESKAYGDPGRAAQVARAICTSLDDRVPANVNVEHISFWPRACEVAAQAGVGSRYIANVPPSMAQLARWASEANMEGFVLEHPYLTEQVLDEVAQAGLTWTSGNLCHSWQLERVLDFGFAPVAVCTDHPHGLLP